MNTATQHPVAPEEIMALLDAELTRAETRAVLQHLEECSACASIEEQLRSASQALAAWSVPPVPSNLNEKVEQRAQEIVSAQRAEKPPARGSSKRNPWAFARGGALVAVAAILL
ncbi:MAG: anti-sigma factor, partial [Acidobacteriaceae bacterium]